jgi:hypothetical protein
VVSYNVIFYIGGSPDAGSFTVAGLAFAFAVRRTSASTAPLGGPANTRPAGTSTASARAAAQRSRQSSAQARQRLPASTGHTAPRATALRPVGVVEGRRAGSFTPTTEQLVLGTRLARAPAPGGRDRRRVPHPQTPTARAPRLRDHAEQLALARARGEAGHRIQRAQQAGEIALVGSEASEPDQPLDQIVFTFHTSPASERSGGAGRNHRKARDRPERKPPATPRKTFSG